MSLSFPEMKFPHSGSAVSMFIFRPCDSAHGKGQIPTERRGSGGSHPTPIPGGGSSAPGRGLSLHKAQKSFSRIFFFLGCSTLLAAKPQLQGGNGRNPKTCSFPAAQGGIRPLRGRGIKLSDSISLSSQIPGEGTSIPCRKRGEFGTERQENLSPPLPGAPLPARNILRGKCYSFHNP